MSEKIRDIKNRFKGKYEDVEVYDINISLSWHTDYLNFTEDYSDDDDVLDYKLMSIDDYEHTILINTCLYAEDLGYKEGDMILCIIRKS
jgi:hypothetical protein